MSLSLAVRDEAMLRGDEGPARRLAMEIVVEMAAAVRAPRLIDIESAHIDGCLPFGQVAFDLPQRLLDDGGLVAVPTTLNVSALDLLHPELPAGDPATAELGRRIAATYEGLGCTPTWTCAPYQLAQRPAFGTDVAWAESNAIVFANSVLGARTSRYGDFFDICAALTGRVPEAGLHVATNRRARVVFRLDGLGPEQLADDLLYALLGTLIGERAGDLVPAIVGLPAGANEDQLKALGAAAASSGSVAMFHAIGITPEAPTLETALGGGRPEAEFAVTAVDLADMRTRLSSAVRGPLTAVALGTPHFSMSEFDRLQAALAGRAIDERVAVYASTDRETYRALEERGRLGELETAGVHIIVDTCTYLRPMVGLGDGTVLTNSAKWAWYAPMTLGVEVVVAGLDECVDSAVAGELRLSRVF